jgi:hypothetical protein
MEKVRIAPHLTGQQQPPRPAASAKKVVVTTTVDLDEADNPISVASSAETDGDEEDRRWHTPQPRRMAVTTRSGMGVTGTAARAITCLEVAPRTYLGLTNDRRRVSLLQVDDNVFIFAPKTAPTEKLEELVSRVLDGLREAPRVWGEQFATDPELVFSPGFPQAEPSQGEPGLAGDDLDLIFNR